MYRIVRTVAPHLLDLLCAIGTLAGGVIIAVLADPHILATGKAHTAWLAVFACFGMLGSDALLSRLAEPIAAHLDRKEQ